MRTCASVWQAVVQGGLRVILLMLRKKGELVRPGLEPAQLSRARAQRFLTTFGCCCLA